MAASSGVDTIAALATAPGPAALAVVRISGPRAPEVLACLSGGADAAPQPRVATRLRLQDPADGSALDEVVVVRYEARSSPTGEELVEISCHGGRLVPAMVLEACVTAGCRRAEPGEFTRRAYLHGKLDLVQAEAVADLVGARSRALQRVALAQLERGLSSRLTELRDSLVRLEARLAHHVDFPEEDDAPVPLGQLGAEARDLADRLSALLRTAPEGELLREGALLVLAGRPNVGKSSLYNALLGEERAIVTEDAGTTRDALEAAVELGGYPFRLVDTAGLREASERVERLGVEVALRYLGRADLVLYCCEAGSALQEVDRAFLEGLPPVPVVRVETKADLPGASSAGDVGDGRFAASVRVSAREGTGLGELRALLARLMYGGLVSASADAPVVTRRRHARALEQALSEVSAFCEALEAEVPPEVACTHLRAAEGALEDMVGAVATEEVLDAVFSQFCVGK